MDKNPETEARWALIQQTRTRNKMTGEPEPGSFGKAFLIWNNDMVDTVSVLRRDGENNAMVIRAVGGQHIAVPISSLRTEGEILKYLEKKHPQYSPKRLTNWWPGQLPISIIREIWGK